MAIASAWTTIFAVSHQPAPLAALEFVSRLISYSSARRPPLAVSPLGSFPLRLIRGKTLALCFVVLLIGKPVPIPGSSPRTSFVRKHSSRVSPPAIAISPCKRKSPGAAPRQAAFPANSHARPALDRYDDNGLGQGKVIREGQIYAGRTTGGRDARKLHGRAPGESDRRPARCQIDDAHVAPKDTMAKAGTQSLGAGLLGGEALGVGCGAGCAAIRFAALDIGKDTIEKPVAEALERRLDAADIDNVVADPEYHRLTVMPSGTHPALSVQPRLVHQ